MNWYLRLAVAVAAALSVVFSSFAAGSPSRKIWCAGNLCVADDGGISPTKLPRRGRAPIKARLNGEISTRDGSHPPAFRTMDLKIDKTIELDAKGLPACPRRQLEARTTRDAEAACKKAIVGSGEGEVEVAFTEQAPFRATGPIVLFNGGTKGRVTTVFVHAYVSVPAPTAIVAEATIAKVDDGRYGLRIKVQLPTIAGGAGSVTTFELEVSRRYAYKGRKKSILMAGCPTGIWMASGRASFVDGTVLSIRHPFPCTPSGS